MRYFPYVMVVLCVCLQVLHIPKAFADSQTFTVYHLPLSEAVSVVKTQLSPAGQVVKLASRNMLIVNDEAKNLRDAAALLKQLDVPAIQYMLRLEVMQLSNQHLKTISAASTLTHGWIKLSSQKYQVSTRKTFHLRVNSARQGMIEVGETQPRHQHVLQWLSAYGLVEHDSVELASFTSGFNIVLRPAGINNVHIHIKPWMSDTQSSSNSQNNSDIVMSVDSKEIAKKMHAENSYVYLNTKDLQKQQQRVDIVSADTKLTVPLNEQVLILAYDSDANIFGNIMLSNHSTQQHLAIRLHITKVQ